MIFLSCFVLIIKWRKKLPCETAFNLSDVFVWESLLCAFGIINAGAQQLLLLELGFHMCLNLC